MGTHSADGASPSIPAISDDVVEAAARRLLLEIDSMANIDALRAGDRRSLCDCARVTIEAAILADRAESAKAIAEAVEIIRPFAAADEYPEIFALDDDECAFGHRYEITAGEIRAASAFVDAHGKDLGTSWPPAPTSIEVTREMLAAGIDAAKSIMVAAGIPLSDDLRETDLAAIYCAMRAEEKRG